MKIEIPEGPVRFSLEEMAELLEMRAASSGEAMSKQLLTKGALIIRAEGATVERLEVRLGACQRQLLALRLALLWIFVGWLVYASGAANPWVEGSAFLTFFGVLLSDATAEHWPKLFRKRRKPKHEPEVLRR